MADTGPITNRRVLRVAVPIVLANATVPILGAVDTGVVGQMGLAAPIGAVGIGAIILSALYWLFGFLRMGTVGLTGQAHGAGNKPEVSALLIRVLILGVLGGLVLIFVQQPLFWASFQVSPASAEVETMARDYMAIRVFSAPAAIALFGITGWQIALERTGAVLIVQIWMNGLNILLDLWFVLGLGWGVEGVAIATFLAEWTGFALALWLCRDVFSTPMWRDWARVFDNAKLKRMAALNADILIRSLLLEAIFVSFLFLGARGGDVLLAANQVLFQFLHITAYMLDGFSFAAEALVGQALGAGARAQLRQSVVLTSLWGLGCVCLLSLALLFFGGPAIDIMSTSLEVRVVSREYLPYVIAAPVVGVAAWMLDGIFVGATRARDMRDTMVISAVVYGVSLLVLIPVLGNHGLWVSLLISFVVRGVTLAWRYPSLEAEADERAAEALKAQAMTG